MPLSLRSLVGAGPVLTDGAWGTELAALGLPGDELPEAWNLSCPDRVAQVAAAYVEAGSRVILTNTFGANRLRLVTQNLGRAVVEINRRGVKISREAAAGRAAVFASIGPSGKLLLTGETTLADLASAFGQQAQALAEAGADALVVETMSDVSEATAAVQAAKATGLPVVACMVFGSGRNLDRTMMGATPEAAAEALCHAGADVIGANCGQGIAGLVDVCRRLRAAGGVPVWIKPNAGLPEVVDGKVLYATTPAEFASYAPALIAAGADFIGGCCGTTPGFIRALRRVLRPVQPS